MSYRTSFTGWAYICLTFLFLAIISGCTPHIPPPESREQIKLPADFPVAYYNNAKSVGNKVWLIDSGRSLVTIIVRRGGALARLGHDHVIASHDVKGYVDMTANRADLYLPLDRLSVDETLLRTDAGLTTQPSAGAIEGTRQNMLVKVLESDRYPFALIHVTRVTGDKSTLKVTITLHGTVKEFEVPVQLVNNASHIKISGQLSFNQTDFAIVPFSILGGALQVQNDLTLNFNILATEN